MSFLIRTLLMPAVSLVSRNPSMALMPSSESVARGLWLGSASAVIFALMPMSVQAASATKTSSWTYTAEGLIQTETIEPDLPAFSQTTTHNYDAYGNKTGATISGAANAPASAQFEPRGVTSVMDAKGRFAVTATNELNHSETRTFDPLTGGQLTLVGPNGVSSSWQYDSLGRKTRELRADGTSTSFEYLYCSGTANGIEPCPVASAKHFTRTTNYAVDGVTVLGGIETLYFDVFDREVRRTGQGIDATGAVKLVIVDSAYDRKGRPSKKSEPYFEGTPEAEIVWQAYKYDLLGRVVMEKQDIVGLGLETDPATVWDTDGKKRVSYSYNGPITVATIERDLTPVVGLRSFAPPLGEVQTRTTLKNSQGQTVSVTDAAGGVTSFSYDPFGNLLATTVTAEGANGPTSVTTSATYDQRGRKLTMSDPDKGSWTYEYNALGEMKRQTDAKGQSMVLTYDLAGRMTSKVAKRSDGSIERTDTWTFDTAANGLGKQASSQSVDGTGAIIATKSITYDSIGRAIQTGQSIDGGVSQLQTATYDPATGRLSDVTYPSGLHLIYEYGALGRLSVVRNAFDNTAYWSAGGQNARDQMLSFTLGNSVQTTRTYDAARGFLVGIQSVGAGGQLVQDLSYAWDNLGILKWREVDGGAGLGGYLESFEYDQLSRMTSNTVTNAAGTNTVALVYDDHGNILSKGDVGDYTYGAGAGPHAVTSIQTAAGTELYQYDANGNLTLSSGGAGRAVTWTTANMPASISRGAANLTFTYDDGQARIKQVGPTQTKYYYADAFGGNRSERVVNASTNLVTWIDQLVVGGEMIAQVETPEATPNAQTVKYMHNDHLGSVQAVTDAAGVKVESFDYDPWGQRRFGGMAAPVAYGSPDTLGSLFGLTTDRGFTDHEMLDEVGLVHMNGRIYDARLARFLSADPFVQDPANSQSYNRYSYVNNNPLAATDPSGYFLSGLFKSIGKFFKKYFKPILSIIISIIGFVLAIPTGGWSIVAAGAINGYISGGWKGALFGAVTSYMSMSPQPAMEFFSARHFFDMAKQAAVGCASAVAGGGSCISGALSSGFSAFASPLTNDMGFTGRLAALSAIGGTSSVIGGGKFSNGAITAAFQYLGSEGAKGVARAIVANDNYLLARETASKPTAQSGVGGTAFVGGFFDYTIKGVAWKAYQAHIANGGSGAYFTWDQDRSLTNWLELNSSANGAGVTGVYGHSYGGDTAATVVARGTSVPFLHTVDPVSWFRPNFQAVAANAGSWQNSNAVGGGSFNFPNIVAGVGGAWNTSPAGYAANSNVNADHATIMCRVHACK